MSVICALSTPKGTGGLAVIRISGAGTPSVVDPILQFDIKNAVPRHAYFTRVVDGSETVDEVTFTYFKAPHSFTGEDTVEISCHGGMFIVNRILSLLIREGAEPAAAGEFTKRAFLNGKLDLAQAEAVIDLIHAESKLASSLALGQLDGHLSKETERIRAILMEVTTEIMAYVDYPEETIGEIDENSILERLQQCEKSLTRLVDSFDKGQIIKEGIPTAILGRPNVGKSTLMNALLGKEKSIVTDIAGTTRDVVEDSALIGDVVLRLCDTAGIRDTDDTVEKIGVDRARAAAENAKLILFVTDAREDISPEEKEILSGFKDTPVIILRNKSDLSAPQRTGEYRLEVNISAKEQTGLDALGELISRLFLGGEVSEDEVILTNLRQQSAVQKARDAVKESVTALQSGLSPDLVGLDVESAAQSLGELVGVSVHEQMIEDIFSRFCVGK